MASGYGNKAGSYGRWQAYVNAWVASETDTTATIRCQAYFHSIAWGFDVGGYGTATVDGSSVSSGRVTMYAPNGATVNQLVVTKDLTVAKQPDGRNVWCSATIQIVGGYQNGTSSVGVNVWVGARRYKKPKPPKGCSLAMASDTSQRLSWSGDYTGMDGDYPWSGVYVDRKVDDAAWVNIADLAWSAVNYTDGSTSAGHKYEYRLRSHGPGGTSSPVSCGTVYTTPTAPTSVKVKVMAGTTVEISASGYGRYATAFDVERSTGGPWERIATDKALPLTDEVGGTAKWRVRAKRGSLASAWRESPEITTITPPLAPAIKGVSAAYATGSEVAVRWERNHPDASSQTAAQVEVAGASGASILDVSGDASSAFVTGLAKGSYKVRVRTRGAHEEWGAWSPYTAFSVADPPQAWVVSPAIDGELVDRAPVSVSVAASDETGIASATLSLEDIDGAVVASYDVTDLKPVDVGSYASLGNGRVYALALTVAGGSTLTATVRRTFMTHWAEAAVPVVSVESDAELACRVTVANGTSAYEVRETTLTGPVARTGGELSMLGVIECADGKLSIGDAAPCASFDVERVLPDGSTARIASGLLDSQGAIDRIPPLNTDFEYKVTGFSESGASSLAVAHARVRAHGMALNFGADASRALVLDYNGEYSTSSERSAETFHFADGGENGHLPVSYPLDELSVSTSASFHLTRDGHDEFRRAMMEEWVGWWRGHAGERAYGAMSFSESVKSPGIWSGSVKVTHEVFEEPTDG